MSYWSQLIVRQFSRRTAKFVSRTVGPSARQTSESVRLFSVDEAATVVQILVQCHTYYITCSDSRSSVHARQGAQACCLERSNNAVSTARAAASN